ncbi:hypothetical protein [uncultured Sphaerochaeta sp.]|uniref:hypothetical protein n=1 Tax=uncultured Sphaerochaeta sp. TaxID=886478 RepID=UPI0026064B71|nr:hypothetical protein [uncultured Sphaerochaeta sp.]
MKIIIAFLTSILITTAVMSQQFVIIEQIQASTVSYGCIDCGDVIVPNFWFSFNNGFYRYADMEVSVVDAAQSKSVGHPLGWTSSWGPTPYLDSTRSPIWYVVINDQPFMSRRVVWSSTPKRVCSIGFSAITDCALDTLSTGYIFRITAWPKRDSLDPRDSSLSFSGTMYMPECSEVLGVIIGGQDSPVEILNPIISYSNNNVIIKAAEESDWAVRVIDMMANIIIDEKGRGRKEIPFSPSRGNYFLIFFYNNGTGMIIKSLFVIE